MCSVCVWVWVCVGGCGCVGTKLTNSINSKYDSLCWGTALYPRSLMVDNTFHLDSKDIHGMVRPSNLSL